MSLAAYETDLRAIARGFWNGTFNDAQFQDLMFNAIDRGLTDAWQTGAKKVGIQPNEITPTEQVKLMTLIFTEYSHVPNLSDFITKHSQVNEGKLRTVFNRIKLWVNRWRDVVNQAVLAARDDPKLKWVLGDAEHCSTCLKLAGKVKRASFWKASGWEPQSRKLACRGYDCKCDLVPTTDPLSRGPLPRTA